MNRLGACLLGSLLMSGAVRNLAANTINFDNVNGHYLAYVYAAAKAGTVVNTDTYTGYESNYGPIAIPNTNLGPAVPGGMFANTAAFVDTLTGNLGVAGADRAFLNDSFSTAVASFSIAVQFNQPGTVSFSMHEVGSISLQAVGGGNDYAVAQLQTSVAIVDNSLVNNTGRTSVGANLCLDRFMGVYGNQCNTGTYAVDTTFTAMLDVLPGHTYTLSVSETGLQVGWGTFDGIDPVTASLQLSPGLSIVPVDGETLPGFLGGPTTPSSSAPEPATWLFLAGPALTIGVGLVRRNRRAN